MGPHFGPARDKEKLTNYMRASSVAPLSVWRSLRFFALEAALSPQHALAEAEQAVASLSPHEALPFSDFSPACKDVTIAKAANTKPTVSFFIRVVS